MTHEIDTQIWNKLLAILACSRERSVVTEFLSKMKSAQPGVTHIFELGTNEYLHFSRSDYFDYVPVRFFLSVEFSATYFRLSVEIPDFDYGGTASASYRFKENECLYSDKAVLFELLDRIELITGNKRNRCMFRAQLNSISKTKAVRK